MKNNALENKAIENKTAGKSFLPIMVLFVVISLGCLLAASWLQTHHIDHLVLLTGNTILFLATSVSFYFYARSFHRTGIQFFLRMMYASLLLKMAVCIGATLLYLFLAGEAVSKYAILTCFGFYIFYTFAEVSILMRSARTQKN